MNPQKTKDNTEALKDLKMKIKTDTVGVKINVKRGKGQIQTFLCYQGDIPWGGRGDLVPRS